MYMSVCKGAERGGAYVLHGSRRAMHNDKQPAFKAVYSAFNAVSNKRSAWTQFTYHAVLEFTGIDYIDLQNDKCKMTRIVHLIFVLKDSNRHLFFVFLNLKILYCHCSIVSRMRWRHLYCRSFWKILKPQQKLHVGLSAIFFLWESLSSSIMM